MEIKEGNQTTTMPVTTPQMSYAEWIAAGKQRFGEDMMKWSFVCPICGHVARVEDFMQYEDRGATPDSATQECIGRYDGSKGTAFGEIRHKLGGPCDYALYGLFRIPGVVVTGSPYAKNGKPMLAFAFA
jgi:hypothetical protein